jgi:hypothetical protein
MPQSQSLHSVTITEARETEVVFMRDFAIETGTAYIPPPTLKDSITRSIPSLQTAEFTIQPCPTATSIAELSRVGGCLILKKDQPGGASFFVSAHRYLLSMNI